MKLYRLLAVLFLSALTLSEAYKTDHSDRGRRSHGSGGPLNARPGGPPDARPGFTCYREVTRCGEVLINKLYRHNINDTITAINQAGFTQVCQDVASAISCAKQGLQLPDCDRMPQEVKGYIQEFLALGEYVCEDREEDISKYWDCLVNPDFITKAIACPDRKPKPKHDCDQLAFEDIAECVGISARRAKGCDPGSDVGLVANDIMMKLLYFGKSC